MRTCRTCGGEKAETEFYKSRGYTLHRCKSCTKEAVKERRKRQQSRTDVSIPAEKQCTRCQQTKPAVAFARDRGAASGLSASCKECVSAWQKAWRKLGVSAARRRQQLRDRKALAIQSLGGACKRCGGVFPDVVYDFHHRVPHEKEAEPNAALGWSIAASEIELSKCDLLCANCHRLTHFEWKNNNVGQ